jgi:hypothetical protein
MESRTSLLVQALSCLVDHTTLLTIRKSEELSTYQCTLNLLLCSNSGNSMHGAITPISMWMEFNNGNISSHNPKTSLNRFLEEKRRKIWWMYRWQLRILVRRHHWKWKRICQIRRLPLGELEMCNYLCMTQALRVQMANRTTTIAHLQPRLSLAPVAG